MAISEKDVAFLAEVPLLGEMDADERRRLASWLRETKLREGQVVLWEGKSHDDLHIIVEGTVVVTKVVRGEVESVLAKLGPGTHFGELDVIDSQRASATVTAVCDARLLSIDRTRLLQLLEADSVLFGRFAWAMMRDLAGKLRKTNVRLLEAVAWGLDATAYDPAADEGER
jgi:PPM family protein phosphatase